LKYNNHSPWPRPMMALAKGEEWEMEREGRNKAYGAEGAL